VANCKHVVKKYNVRLQTKIGKGDDYKPSIKYHSVAYILQRALKRIPLQTNLQKLYQKVNGIFNHIIICQQGKPPKHLQSYNHNPKVMKKEAKNLNITRI